MEVHQQCLKYIWAKHVITTSVTVEVVNLTVQTGLRLRDPRVLAELRHFAGRVRATFFLPTIRSNYEICSKQ